LRRCHASAKYSVWLISPIIDEKLDRVSDDLRTRVGILEQQYASMSNRIDRIETLLERIERRLELAEA
jgi:hypothetical protein